MAMHQRHFVIALGNGQTRVAVVMRRAARRPAAAGAADAFEPLEEALDRSIHLLEPFARALTPRGQRR